MQLNRTEILERLKDILLMADDKSRVAAETCSEDSLLIGDLGLNSVGMLYVVIAAEEMFGIRFEDVGMADFKCVRDVVDYIEARLS